MVSRLNNIKRYRHVRYTLLVSVLIGIWLSVTASSEPAPPVQLKLSLFNCLGNRLPVANHPTQVLIFDTDGQPIDTLNGVTDAKGIFTGALSTKDIDQVEIQAGGYHPKTVSGLVAKKITGPQGILIIVEPMVPASFCLQPLPISITEGPEDSNVPENTPVEDDLDLGSLPSEALRLDPELARRALAMALPQVPWTSVILQLTALTGNVESTLLLLTNLKVTGYFLFSARGFSFPPDEAQEIEPLRKPYEPVLLQNQETLSRIINEQPELATPLFFLIKVEGPTGEESDP